MYEFSRMQESVLTANVLAEFVVIGEDSTKLVPGLLTLLKLSAEDPIYYYIGTTLHKTMADGFGIPHKNIGFAGSIYGTLNPPNDTRLLRGGGSLSREFKRNTTEENRAFELIGGMIGQLGGQLKWAV